MTDFVSEVGIRAGSALGVVTSGRPRSDYLERLDRWGDREGERAGAAGRRGAPPFARAAFGGSDRAQRTERSIQDRRRCGSPRISIGSTTYSVIARPGIGSNR